MFLERFLLIDLLEQVWASYCPRAETGMLVQVDQPSFELQKTLCGPRIRGNTDHVLSESLGDSVVCIKNLDDPPRRKMLPPTDLSHTMAHLKNPV